MTTEESQKNDSSGRYMGWWWCQWRYCKTSVEAKYNYDGLLKQHRSHGMIIAGVDEKSIVMLVFMWYIIYSGWRGQRWKRHKAIKTVVENIQDGIDSRDRGPL